MNKRDLLDDADLRVVHGGLHRQFPQAELHVISARENVGLEKWFRRVTYGERRSRATMELDYDLYADGEARLAWMNATVGVTARPAVNASAILISLAGGLRARLIAEQAGIAHCKMTLRSLDSAAVAAINLVRSDLTPELSMELDAPVSNGVLMVNVRAETAPAELPALLRAALVEVESEHAGLALEITQCDAFAPARPVPTHRDAGVLG